MADTEDVNLVPLNSSTQYVQEPSPGRHSPLGWRGSGQCVFCESPDTEWQHDLDASRATFRTMFGKGKVWGGALLLCQRCENFYGTGEYAQLARLQTSEPPAYEDQLADHLISLAAFCRADRGVRRLPEPDFPDGFRPIEELTGFVEVFDQWPAARRLVVAETRRPQLDDDPGAQIFLVASPWPSVSLDDVFRMLWGWVHRDRDHRQTEESQRSRAAEVLSWSEPAALAYLRHLEGEST